MTLAMQTGKPQQWESSERLSKETGRRKNMRMNFGNIRRSPVTANKETYRNLNGALTKAYE
jgi:hypothetical protein